MRSAVAIYARISQDRSGEMLGVKRQLIDCRAEAERRGWRIAEEYVDDDVSAYSGKRRPGYERMLEQLRTGERDAVITYHMDRLARQPKDLERFVQACSDGRVTEVVTLHGDMNLSSGDGLLMARILAAGAAWESDAKSRRQKRKMLELAQAGMPKGGGVRPFGFNDDRMTLNEAEADAIRACAARFLAGEPLVSITRWLHETDVRTVTGKQWRTQTVRQLLLSPRIAGLREYQGQVIGKAVWPAIITEEEYARIAATFSDPNRTKNRAARRYLLSGLLRCGSCGSKMVSMSQTGGRQRRYLCRSGVDFGGCGGISATAPPLEELIRRSVLLRLDTPELAAALSGRQRATETAADLSEEIAADDAQLRELAAMYAAKEITATEWRVARAEIDRRLQTNRRRQAQLSGTSAINAHVGNGQRLSEQWDSLELNAQRAIIANVIDHVIINKSSLPRGSHSFDPSRVVPVWQL